MNKEQEIIKNLQSCIDRQKEEIERLTLSEREAYKQLERGNERMMAIIAEEREDAIKEVAREIFEEIDKVIKEHSQGYCCDWYLYELIDKLKEKYTKGGERYERKAD